MAIRIKNWSKFQHFKDRTPPWVKLYRDILDDPDWHELDGESAKTLTMLWLIASEDDTHQGTLPESKRLAFRLRISEQKLKQTLTKLSHWLIQADTDVISERYQDDAPETETETERETETETSKPYDAVRHLVCLGVEKSIAEDWMKTRKVKKLAATETAINGVVNEANKAGKPMAEVIRICCEQGWGGFKAQWLENLPADYVSVGSKAEQIAEAERKEAERRAAAKPSAPSPFEQWKERNGVAA